MSLAPATAKSVCGPPLPPISHVLETCLYVRGLVASVNFYKELLKVEPVTETSRTAAFALGDTTLLLFQLGQTSADLVSTSGTIPGHGPTEEILTHLFSKSGKPNDTPATLKQHFCIAVSDPTQVDAWEKHLRDLNVKILGVNNWERGGKSVYFEDLDGHVGEVASRGTWPHY